MNDDALQSQRRRGVLLLAAGSLSLVLSLLALHLVLLDGIAGLVWSRFLVEDTEYAPGYSDEAFRRVEAGMTREEVRALLGEPLDAWERGDVEGERWSRSPASGHYRIRVVLYEGGRVVRKRAAFYVD